MNLFILILLNEFANFRSDPENPCELFKKRVIEFRTHWANFTSSTKGQKMHRSYFFLFFLNYKLLDNY